MSGFCTFLYIIVHFYPINFDMYKNKHVQKCSQDVYKIIRRIYHT